MQPPFSRQLENWLRSKGPKTLADLTAVFAEKSFAIAVLLLMFLPALPLPTGGITHVFELIVMLLGSELIIGRHTVWLPYRWRQRPLGEFWRAKTMPLIIRRVRWFERFSRRRLAEVMNHPLFLRLVGLLFLVFALAAFLAPPFAGLDTLPALGAVMIALSLILEDVALFGFGCLVGAVGVGLVLAAGGITLHFIQHFWRAI